MQAAVDELLLEVLEHLPRTVGDFEGKMEACSAMFEPEAVVPTHKGAVGPLSVVLQSRQQIETYCTTPLVVDYMWRKFTKGVPSLEEVAAALEKQNKLLGPGQTIHG